MTVSLEVVRGPSAGSKVELPAGDSVQVGRTTRAQVVFPGDQHMSGLHFALDRHAGGLAVRDLNSRNGTFVNDQRVDYVLVTDGDRIKAGLTELMVHILSTPPQAPAPPAVAPSQPEGVSRSVTMVNPPDPAGTLLAPQMEAAPAPAPPTPSASALPSAAPGVAEVAPGIAKAVPESSLAAEPSGAAGPSQGEDSETVDLPRSSRDMTKPLPMIQNVAQSTLIDAPWLPPLTPETARLLELLRERFQPLYAILDASLDPTVLALLFQSDQEYAPLHGGVEGQKLAVGPYLVRLPADSSLFEAVVRASWGKGWGVFLSSDSPLADVLAHLRQFLTMRLPQGKQVYFRFYDPGVLRVYLPSCTPEECGHFFGPVSSFAIEDEKPESLLEFVRGETGMKSSIVQLASSESQAGEVPPASPLEKPNRERFDGD